MRLVVACSLSTTELVQILNSSALQNSREFEATGDLEYLDQAIEIQTLAIGLAYDGYESLPGFLNNLGNCLMHRFQQAGNTDDLAEGISAQRRAVDLTPEGDAYLPEFLSNLGTLTRMSFERTGKMEEISESMSINRRAVSLCREAGRPMHIVLVNLGNTLLSRFESLGSLDDLSEAILVFQESMEVMPEGYPKSYQILNNLGVAYRLRFDHSRNIEDIVKAIATYQEALTKLQDGHILIPSVLNNLSVSFTLRFEETGDINDLKRAIDEQRRAVELTPEGHGDLPSRLNNLGLQLRDLYRRTWDTEYISEAIAEQQRAVNYCPEDNAKLPDILNGLGISFNMRFRGTGDDEDLAEAISIGRRCVEMAPEGHVRLPAFLNSLAVFLRSSFEDTGNIAEIDESVASLRRAISMVPPDHPDMPVWLTSLSDVFLSRFKGTKDVNDVSEAIAIIRRAIEVTPDGNADLRVRFNILGRALHARYKNESPPAPDDIAGAISAFNKTIALMPEGDGSLPTLLGDIGEAYLSRLIQSDKGHVDPEDFKACISHLKSSALSASGSPGGRMRAAMTWAQLVQHDPHSAEVLNAFDRAVVLMASIGGLERTVRRRYEEVKLEDTSGFVRMACASACMIGRADKALEWLEQGRCLVWGQLTALRTSLDGLSEHDSGLAQTMMALAKQLDDTGLSRSRANVSMPMSKKMSLEQEAREHLTLARRWDALLATARAIPGFENLLKPSPCRSLLRDLPPTGITVVINVHESRCDALALRSGQDAPIRIHLSEFSFDKAVKYRRLFNTQLYIRSRRELQEEGKVNDDTSDRAIARYIKPHAGNDERSVYGILKALWVELVKPIFDALGMPVSPLVLTKPHKALAFLTHSTELGAFVPRTVATGLVVSNRSTVLPPNPCRGNLRGGRVRGHSGLCGIFLHTFSNRAR